MTAKCPAPSAAFGDLVHVKPIGDSVRVIARGVKLPPEGKQMPWSIELERYRLSGAIEVSAIKNEKPKKPEQKK